MQLTSMLSLFSLVATATSATPYHEYILAPPSRTLRPVAVYTQHGPLTAETALLQGHSPSADLPLELDAFNSSVTYDFGKNIGGLVNMEVTSRNGSVGVTFTESSLWVSSATCDASNFIGVDAPLVFNVTSPGLYEAPLQKERGAFRYLTIVNLGTEKLSIKDLWVHFTAMPHWPDDALQNYTGWFHSNDEKLNRVWYAGAYTNQLVTIDPTRGFGEDVVALLFPKSTMDQTGANTTDDIVLDWGLGTTIASGPSVLVDGAKRDRLVWSGDMSISVPGIAVSTLDLISVRTALDSLFALQSITGMLPYVGSPIGVLGIVSFTYHLYGLIGVVNYYQWSGDRSYVHAKWAGWKSGMEWAIQQIDLTGLANVLTPFDWLRFGMGGHNIEANAILFYTLNLGVTLARLENDTLTADRWAQLASRIQATAVPLLWQPSVGLFRDNETTTLAPQDGNAWAVKSGLVTSPSQVAQISSALQARWGPHGAIAPEAANSTSPFISGFELETHFMANRTDAALALVRTLWADFMLDDPQMTNSTFVEGYSPPDGPDYAIYLNTAMISHAHGWSTGPTSSLMAFVGGIQILSEAGATWAIVPQFGDLSHVDAGFSTSKGLFSSRWSVNESVFQLHIVVPTGTTGTVGLPLPGNHTKVTVTGGPAGLREAVVEGDAAGRVWVEDVQGGEYDFVVTGL